VLNRGIAQVRYPLDFALLYLVGTVSIAAGAFVASRYDLPPLDEEPRSPFVRYLAEGLRGYARNRSLVVLWLAYLLWYVALGGMSNLSLYTRAAVGRDPKDLSGVILALRFGCKSLGGWALGVIALRSGIRAPLLATVLLLGGAALWAWSVPGYGFLLAFGLMGAGELGGAYFPNYLLSLSSAAEGPRNLSLLNLVTPASAVGPVLHGALTEAFGFRSSFALGGLMAATALALVLRLPRVSRLQR